MNRRKVNEKKLEKTETKRKDIYKYKKADTFIFFGIITVIIFSTLVITGTLEKLGLNVNLRDNEFVTRWKELVMQSGAVTEKELSETAIQEQELAKLASQDSEMTEQLSTKTTGTYGSLDTMLETVRKEKREKKELDKSLEELKKKKNLEMLKNQRERIGVIVDDIRKYEEIVSSEYGQEMKDTAWQNLISLYTDARDIPLGDIVGFKRIYGISYEISRSFGRNLSVSQIQSMPNLEMINIDTDGSWVSVYSTVEHDYVKKLIEGDHVVVDHATGLMWYRGDQAVTRGKKEWDEAKECVWGMNAKGGYAGYQDWRLPTVEEAASLLSIEDPCFAIKGLGLFLSSIWTADRYDSKSVWVVSCGGVISLRDRWKSQTNNFIDIFPVRLIMKQDKEDTKE